MAKRQGSRHDNEQLGEDIGVSLGYGKKQGAAVGGLFGSDGGYGRYYEEISSSDEDLAEDKAEQRFATRIPQNIRDRFTQNPGGPIPINRVIARNLDRAEDFGERRYALAGKRQKFFGKIGATRLEEQAKATKLRTSSRAKTLSEMQENPAPADLPYGLIWLMSKG